MSGFTASDNEEHEDMRFKMTQKGKKNKRDLSDEEEWDAENRDIVLNPKEDIKERFMQHENLRRKNEEERKQRGILTNQSPENIQNVPLKVNLNQIFLHCLETPFFPWNSKEFR